MAYAYFAVATTGTGSTSDPYRPEVANEPGLEGWSACYEQPQEQRVIVLVKAPQTVLDALASAYEQLYTGGEVGLVA